MENPYVKQLADPVIETLRNRPYGYSIIDGKPEENDNGKRKWVFRYPLKDSFVLVLHTKKPVDVWKYEIEGEECEKKSLTISAKNSLAEFVSDFKQVQADILAHNEKHDQTTNRSVGVPPEKDVPPDMKGYVSGGKDRVTKTSKSNSTSPMQKPTPASQSKAVASAKPPATLSSSLSGTRFNFTDEQLVAIQQTVAKGATPAEFIMFMYIANSYGLDPFLKEIYYSAPMKTVITGRDGYLKIAQNHPDFLGINSMAICSEDEFEVDMVNYTVKHVIKCADRGEVIGAWAKVERKGRRPVISYASLKEHKGTSSAWKYVSAMICKCAEVFALKRQFAINGLVTHEEMEFRDEVSYTDFEKGVVNADYTVQGEEIASN